MDNHQKKVALYREVFRKLFHLMELPVLLGYTLLASFYSPKVGILALTVLLIIFLEIEYIRLEYKLKLPVSIDVFRSHERHTLAGYIFFVSSTIICFAAFDYPIALLALLYTVFGDLMAAIVGIMYGRRFLYKRKTLEGFLAGLVANLLVGFAVIPGEWEIFIPMAITASIVELFTGKLDDNLTVPLASGFVGQILLFLAQASLITFPGPMLQWVAALLPV